MRWIGGRRGRVAVAAATSALGLIGAALILRDVQLAEIGHALAAADWAQLAWAVLAVQVANVAKAQRWCAIVGSRANNLAWSTALIYLGQAINNFAPARAGDLARVELQARRGGLDRARLLGAVAAEKLMDLAILGALSLCLLPLVPGLGGLDLSRIGGGAGLALGGLVTVSIAAPFLARRLVGWRGFVASIVHRFAEGAAVLRRRAAGPIFVWGAAAWLAGGLGNYWALRALGVEPAWLPAFVLLVVGYAGAPVPALPGRLGLHQALCIAALAPFGLASSVALTVAAIIYLQSIILPSLVGGVVGAWFLRGSLVVAERSGVVSRTV